VITVGRIVCENESPLNEGALFLESSRNIGSGVRVSLDCSSVSNLALFPGQIVMVEGINSDGRVFHVQRFLQPSNPLLKFGKPFETYADYDKFADKSMAVLVAAGPYTLDQALDFSPLSSLLQRASELKPEILILFGPFVDVDHSLFKSGNVNDFPEEIFKQQVLLRLSEFSDDNPQTRIILIPSLRDAVASEFIYPQCPLKLESHPVRF
jgi:DNA polymerase alpha subunit B